jgi:hypothetical protein
VGRIRKVNFSHVPTKRQKQNTNLDAHVYCNKKHVQLNANVNNAEISMGLEPIHQLESPKLSGNRDI